MSKRIFWYLYIFLMGCAHYSKSLIDKEFVPYLNEFNAQATSRNLYIDYTHLFIRFEPNPKRYESDVVVAQCTPYSWIRLIEVNPYYWYSFSHEKREIVLFHELGHCLFKLDHQDKNLEIMNTYLMDNYMGMRSYYLDQFFAEVPQ